MAPSESYKYSDIVFEVRDKIGIIKVRVYGLMYTINAYGVKTKVESPDLTQFVRR